MVPLSLLFNLLSHQEYFRWCRRSRDVTAAATIIWSGNGSAAGYRYQDGRSGRCDGRCRQGRAHYGFWHPSCTGSSAAQYHPGNRPATLRWGSYDSSHAIGRFHIRLIAAVVIYITGYTGHQ